MIRIRLRAATIALGIILAVLLISYGYLYFFEKAVPVKIAEAKIGNLLEIVKMSGHIDSESTENIISNTEGIIANLKIKEGERVKKGEVLCVIRNPGLREKLLEMRAELVTAKENLKAALNEGERKMAQARHNFITENIADLEETMQPRAHIDGDAIRVDVKNGYEVTRGVRLFFLVDMANPVVKARMDEEDVQKVKEGQSLWVTGDFLSGGIIEGKVLRISKFVDKEVGTYVETTCKIFNPGKLPIKYGAYADVRIITNRKKDVLIIPKEALVIEENEMTHVFVVKNNRAYLTPIKAGLIGENDIEVLSGLKKGEKVATSGSLDLFDKVKVKITN